MPRRMSIRFNTFSIGDLTATNTVFAGTCRDAIISGICAHMCGQFNVQFLGGSEETHRIFGPMRDYMYANRNNVRLDATIQQTSPVSALQPDDPGMDYVPHYERIVGQLHEVIPEGLDEFSVGESKADFFTGERLTQIHIAGDSRATLAWWWGLLLLRLCTSVSATRKWRNIEQLIADSNANNQECWYYSWDKRDHLELWQTMTSAEVIPPMYEWMACAACAGLVTIQKEVRALKAGATHGAHNTTVFSMLQALQKEGHFV